LPLAILETRGEVIHESEETAIGGKLYENRGRGAYRSFLQERSAGGAEEAGCFSGRRGGWFQMDSNSYAVLIGVGEIERSLRNAWVLSEKKRD